MTTVADRFIANLEGGDVFADPFRHWIMREVFPDAIARELDGIEVPAGEDLDYGGQRECNNAQRVFFSPDVQARNPAAAAVAGALADPRTVAAIERVTGCDLEGSLLRVEYAQDSDGFWLEPHTDIGAKRFTLLCYLSVGEGGEGCGTDLFHPDRTLAKTPPFHFNTALVFVPGQDTWHGFAPRPIPGIRKSVIVNYVTPDWRARHELASERPVR